jgi:hypothetical protein
MLITKAMTDAGIQLREARSRARSVHSSSLNSGAAAGEGARPF